MGRGTSARAHPAVTAPAVQRVQAAAFTVPTDFPESDGTLEWTSTTSAWI